ncbi:hypothetical protein N9965_01435 [bacterium]|nr:hypothetical protein [Akkermansiaceae bacterium]MDA8960098.1 hypothetical protein [Akkermansiaceae bacterium]MDB4311078.1 hypothetical protein [bacterium]MDC1405505.1 hypothetical protein [Akkermansiaceae bacterium]
MFDHDDDANSGGYWPSVADLFITLFIISIVMLGAVFYVLLPKNNIAGKGVIVAVGKDFNNVLGPMNKLRKELDMEMVEYRSADKAIKDLEITCDVAVERIRVFKQLDPDGMAQEIARLKKQVEELQRQIKMLTVPDGSESVAALKQRIKDLEDKITELKKDAPTVVIGEHVKEFRFDSGSPVISRKFSEALRNSIVNENGGEIKDAPFYEIARSVIERQERINTLEIIGHTDGTPLSRIGGNLDQKLPELLAGDRKDLKSLKAGSNNDLGLLRALALKQEWLSFVDTYPDVKKREVLRSLNIRCYSAGQTILPKAVKIPTAKDYKNNDDNARRIEMRLTFWKNGEE